MAWLSLDRRDNDPGLFWAYLVGALKTAVQGAGASALPELQPPQPPTEAGLATLLNDLDAISDDVVLVLDDYHVIEARDVQDGMAFLLEHLPPQIHLMIASRADPALPLARLRGRGELVEIRAADLRFTPIEAAAYLNEVMGLVLTAPDVAALEGRTEGWIAALQLAALSMQGREDNAAFIAGFAGDDRYIVDYLAEEVLQRQPEHVPAVPAADLHPGPVERPALRCRHRPRWWPGQAGGAGARGTCSWSRWMIAAGGTASITSSSRTSCRRGLLRTSSLATFPACTGRGRATGYRAERRAVRGDPPRAGRRGFRAGGGPGRAGDSGHAQDQARGCGPWLAQGASRGVDPGQARAQRGAGRGVAVRGRV